MSDIASHPNLPGEIVKGVASVPPPLAIRESIHEQAQKVLADLTEGEHTAIVAMATRLPDGTVSVNFQVAQRIGEHWTAACWMGKVWGEPVEGGAYIRAAW